MYFYNNVHLAIIIIIYVAIIIMYGHEFYTIVINFEQLSSTLHVCHMHASAVSSGVVGGSPKTTRFPAIKLLENSKV